MRLMVFEFIHIYESRDFAVVNLPVELRMPKYEETDHQPTETELTPVEVALGDTHVRLEVRFV